MPPTPEPRQENHDVFRVEVEPDGSAAYVTPWGELDMSTVGVLQDRLDELRRSGRASFVLDLRRLTFMDSSGAHLVQKEHALAKGNGGNLVLIAGPRPVHRVFEILGLLDTLPFHDSEAG